MVYSCCILTPLFLTTRTNLNVDPTACMVPRWLADAKLHGMAKIKLNVIRDKASCSAACGSPPAPCCQCINGLSGAALTLLRSMSLHNEGRL